VHYVETPELKGTFETGGVTLCECPSSIERAISVEFDWDAIEPIPEPCHDHSAIEVLQRMQQLMRWGYNFKADHLDSNGMLIRFAILAWIFVPELQDSSLSKFSRGLGKKKQSLGRWITDFKQEFPAIAAINKHLEHLEHHDK
jgi:hypothetical protein